MININKETFYDKVYGCWLGKSIGGTLGTPFEARRELLNVTGFTSPEGKPLPNDDLDLQLIWLKALEEYGPLGINEHVLGEYWINYISPHWNEYGIGKKNMKAGLLPPLSGDYENVWKHSNGAWIRSEIWACCAPGCPEIATKYAWYDACVDHGTGEGTYAELFTSSIESAAFIESDPKTLIKLGLSYIPKDCRVARSVGIVLDAHEEGLDWKETRRLVLEDSEDLGWFQAPANVAFFVIGWLYGGGDFKKSLLIAVNCGDDTDCTAATLGSILGIISGAKGLPADWKRYVGEDIVTIAVDRGSWGNIPTTCTDLTRRVISMAHQVLSAHQASVTIKEEEDNFHGLKIEKLLPSETYLENLSEMSGAIRYDFIHSLVSVDYINGIDIKADQEFAIQIEICNKMPDPRNLEVSYMLPEGFQLIEGTKHINLPHTTDKSTNRHIFTVRFCAGSTVNSVNRGVIQMVSVGRPTIILIPLIFFGK